MSSLVEYSIGSKIYIDLKHVFDNYPNYRKGIRSLTQLIARKGYHNYVNGNIIDGVLTITEKRSRKNGSIFVNKDELTVLFENIETIPIAPPILDDTDLVFFKDEDGQEYHVEMRGDRTPEGIFFRGKDVAHVFQMENLQKVMLGNDANYNTGEHYCFFDVSIGKNLDNATIHCAKEMFLTYAGIMRIIAVSRSGIGYKFKKWITEIVFAALFGTQAQKAKVVARIINVDAEHLKAIMNKSAEPISCLYLIDITIQGIVLGSSIPIATSSKDKSVYKLGLSDNITRRFKEHCGKYGDKIKLIKFVFIPKSMLYAAETHLKRIVKSFKYEQENETELIALNNSELESVVAIYQSISRQFCGNLEQVVSSYESMIKDAQHQIEVVRLECALALSEKDNEILRLKLQLAGVAI